MKKLLTIAAIGFMAAMLFSCAGKSTPESVVEKAVKCIQKKDYKGYVDLLKFKNDKDEDADKQAKAKEEYAALIQQKAESALAEKGGIKDYKIGDVEMNEEGNQAKVKLSVTYGDGTTKDDTMGVVKDEDGNWKLDGGK